MITLRNGEQKQDISVQNSRMKIAQQTRHCIFDKTEEHGLFSFDNRVQCYFWLTLNFKLLSITCLVPSISKLEVFLNAKRSNIWSDRRIIHLLQIKYKQKKELRRYILITLICSLSHQIINYCLKIYLLMKIHTTTLHL